MCSRYSLTSPAEAVRAVFRVRTGLEFPPRYNIAPSQPVAIVRIDHRGERELALVRWGFVPSWAKDPRALSPMINARGETAAAKPAFRAAMRHRRCLVPANGFYEWTGPPRDRRPSLVRPADGGLVAFAGLWEPWLGADGSEIETMAILTTAASPSLTHLHDRMPAILQPGSFEAWLDCRNVAPDEASLLLQPAPDGLLETVAVSKAVNNPRNEGPELHSLPA